MLSYHRDRLDKGVSVDIVPDTICWESATMTETAKHACLGQVRHDNIFEDVES